MGFIVMPQHPIRCSAWNLVVCIQSRNGQQNGRSIPQIWMRNRVNLTLGEHPAKFGELPQKRAKVRDWCAFVP